MKTIIAILFTLFIALHAVSVERQSGKITATTNKLWIEITGNSNVPKFSFKDATDANAVTYRVMFQKVYQVESENDTSALPSTTISLPSLQYDFSDFIYEEENRTVAFNITGWSKDDAPVFIFRVKIDEDTLAFKFDTIIKGFDGAWHAKGNYLVLAYKLQQSKGGADSDADKPTVTTEASKTVLRSGKMKIKSDNFANDGSVNVINKADTEGNSPYLYIYYEKWNGQLVHDPELSISDSSANTARGVVGLAIFVIVFIAYLL